MGVAGWTIVAAYLCLVLVIGFTVRRAAGKDRESYFLAGRSLPWWWAGLSIAATTFAADTPLAVTGIVASRGLSGNWIWLSWIGVHGAVVIYFARAWRRSRVITDAEFVALRYSGPEARKLRWFRAGLYGVVYNVIVLGWVLSAMGKIVAPFFSWEEWLPGLTEWLGTVLPDDSRLGSASDTLTIVLLVLLVAVYSTLGGLRGVVITDLVQLGIALAGSVWFAWVAWDAVGGRSGLHAGLDRLYGPGHGYLDLFPSTGSGWLAGLGLGAFAFGAYLFVQSYANVPADGGGYLSQRLNATRTPRDAERASLLFVVIQYVVRTLPWFVVAAAALVLIPLGGEETALGGTVPAVAGDRELAYPVLIGVLLPPIGVGLLVTSLLAAFMSTVDTHINWGASYVVNDVLLPLRPDVSEQTQVRVARIAVIVFVAIAVFVSLHIQTIEQAWRWVAILGAALGVPTALRWIWWRVTAVSELCAMGAGLFVALIMGLAWAHVIYELRLVFISAASVVGLLIGIWLGPATDDKVLLQFVQLVKPRGFWPGQTLRTAAGQVAVDSLRWFCMVAGVLSLVVAGWLALFNGAFWQATGLGMTGAALVYLATGAYRLFTPEGAPA